MRRQLKFPLQGAQWIGRLGGLALALAFAFAALAGAAPASAQTVRYGVVMDGPRQALAARWTTDPSQVERAYCITDYSEGAMGMTTHASARSQPDSIYRVFQVVPAYPDAAGPNSVDFECPPGVPELHTHTPSTCTSDDVKTCVAGGLNAYSCQPSRADLAKLVRRHDPFAVIQCDRHDFRFYYAVDYQPPVAGRSLVAGGAERPTLTPSIRTEAPASPRNP